MRRMSVCILQMDTQIHAKSKGENIGGHITMLWPSLWVLAS